MPTIQYGHHQVHYELTGEPGRPVITFLNGLTQNANLWKSYADYFVPRGYRVLAYDMLAGPAAVGDIAAGRLLARLMTLRNMSLGVWGALGAGQSPVIRLVNYIIFNANKPISM